MLSFFASQKHAVEKTFKMVGVKENSTHTSEEVVIHDAGKFPPTLV